MSVFFICVSILSFCLKTHPNLRVPVIRNVTIDWSRSALSSPVLDIYHRFRNQHPTRQSNWTTSWTLDKTRTEPHQAFFFVELVCLLSIAIQHRLVKLIGSKSCYRCAMSGSRWNSLSVLSCAPTNVSLPGRLLILSTWWLPSRFTQTFSYRLVLCILCDIPNLILHFENCN